MSDERSEQGPSDGDLRGKLARICDRAAGVTDVLTVVSPFLNDKGPVIAVTTGLLSLGLRFAARKARGQ